MEKRAINPGDWQDQFDFSQAIEVRQAERVVYCSGQVSVDADGATLNPGNLEAQFRQALDNLETVLEETGLGLADIVRLNYYTTDVAAFLKVVPGVGKRLKAAGCKPASTLVGVVRLAEPEWMIEIEATAVG
jgi:enamine deaminase RidA (YjgF/YER057c/UK114 family)